MKNQELIKINAEQFKLKKQIKIEATGEFYESITDLFTSILACKNHFNEFKKRVSWNNLVFVDCEEVNVNGEIFYKYSYNVWD
jgi:hypothetical protein